MTCTTEKVRRTKFFFGARYIWTKQQLSEPHSMVGAGKPIIFMPSKLIYDVVLINGRCESRCV